MGLPFKTVKLWQRKYLSKKLTETTCERGSWKYDRFSKLVARHGIKRGVATEIIAEKVNLDVNLVSKWKNEWKKVQRQKMKRARCDFEIPSRSSRHPRKRGVLKNPAKPRTFVPLRKVYIPNRMKLRFVKMIDGGVQIEKLSEELNVNQLTIKSWIFNRDLLTKSQAVNGGID